MASWTIICKGSSGEVVGKSFGLSLDTDNESWTADGLGVNLFFTSKSGKYAVITDTTYGMGTQLKNATGKVAAFVEGLTGTSAVGATGQGHALEKGETFSWKLLTKQGS